MIAGREINGGGSVSLWMHTMIGQSLGILTELDLNFEVLVLNVTAASNQMFRDCWPRD